MNFNLSALTQFHPLVEQWFKERVGQPTEVQEQVWPKIAAREHLLITAPTGTGKTLAAFLWALHQMITQQWSTGQTRVLYVSPLRALNYDIQRNLLGPLNELGEIFREGGEDFPEIHVLTRSGDTLPSDRRQMVRRPPRAVPRPELPEDLLEREELRKDRARLLLDRYGILFRELLQKEWPALRWSNVFRALRIMELSGEVMAGIFFHGIPGPQFISHRAFRRLQRKLPEETIYWINATGPASLCGIQLDSVRGMVPARVATTHLVYEGNRLIVVSKRNGKDLIIHAAPDDPNLPDHMVVLRHLLTRKFQPMKRVSIETINGEKAPHSPYLPALRTLWDVAVDYKNVTLYRKIR